MNVADSAYLSEGLDALGYQPVRRPEDADVIVLNTCVVRQSAENRALGRLTSLKPLKERNPRIVLAVMGCLVGVRPEPDLPRRFPYVDLFLPPSDPEMLLNLLRERNSLAEGHGQEAEDKRQGLLPPVTAYVPVIHGCDHACSYCIVPYRRGRERSRPVEDIVAEVQGLVARGVREVTLLGQIVDRYGRDLGSRGAAPGPDLADLLRAVHTVEGLWRIRFLTSHPLYLSQRIVDAVAELPKVCEHIEVPVQAGNDETLRRMRRGYTVAAYRQLVDRIRRGVADCNVSTDVIVGFPGETVAQFRATYDLVEELRFDQVHVAAYSPRSGTLAARRMADDVPPEEKKRRLTAVDELQERIVGEINRRLQGHTVEVLVEERQKGKWRGRTRTNKLVFFRDDADWRGRLAAVRITWAGPWSMQGDLEIDQTS
jgi:tRNA-2-methylthio-N6-dimethylallyladenosine synthase